MTFFAPGVLKTDANYTLIFNIEKESIDNTTERETMKFGFNTIIDANLKHYSKNISKSYKSMFPIRLERDISRENIRELKVQRMPGFRINWHFNKEVDSPVKYTNNGRNKEFIRYPKL